MAKKKRNEQDLTRRNLIAEKKAMAELVKRVRLHGDNIKLLDKNIQILKEAVLDLISALSAFLGTSVTAPVVKKVKR